MDVIIAILGFSGIFGFFISIGWLVFFLVKKKPVKKPLISLVICFAVFCICAGLTNRNEIPIEDLEIENTDTAIVNDISENSDAKVETTANKPNSNSSKETKKDNITKNQIATEKPVTAKAETTTSLPIGQRNALKSAKDYLSAMPFSYSGLIKQLEHGGYSSEDATFGADNCGANWNEQAAKAAKSYIDTMPFSRTALIDQLIYAGFTKEQAEYGATSVGY